MIDRESSLNILIIEDSDSEAFLIKGVLDQAMSSEYISKHVKTLSDALDILAHEEYAVVLLDRTLPDADEFEGLHKIQNISPRVPIIFLTGYDDELAAFEAIEQGAQDYLFKDKMDGYIMKRAIQYAILRKQFEGVLVVQANYDVLTGLANRHLFESQLDMSLARMHRQNGNLSVLFLDLDHFKEINDTLGHSAGDAILTEFAKRLKAVLRPYDVASRYGGDEFTVIVDGMSVHTDSEVVAQKIIKLFDEPFEFEGQAIDMNVSIGITVCQADQKVDRDEVIKQADSAMYQAKGTSGSAYSIREMP